MRGMIERNPAACHIVAETRLSCFKHTVRA
jgi:hypothetical protein